MALQHHHHQPLPLLSQQQLPQQLLPLPTGIANINTTRTSDHRPHAHAPPHRFLKFNKGPTARTISSNGLALDLKLHGGNSYNAQRVHAFTGKAQQQQQQQLNSARTNNFKRRSLSGFHSTSPSNSSSSSTSSSSLSSSSTSSISISICDYPLTPQQHIPCSIDAHFSTGHPHPQVDLTAAAVHFNTDRTDHPDRTVHTGIFCELSHHSAPLPSPSPTTSATAARDLTAHGLTAHGLIIPSSTTFISNSASTAAATICSSSQSSDTLTNICLSPIHPPINSEKASDKPLHDNKKLNIIYNSSNPLAIKKSLSSISPPPSRSRNPRPQSMASYFDDSQQDSTLSSTDSTNSAQSFLSVASNSSAASSNASLSNYHHQYSQTNNPRVNDLYPKKMPQPRLLRKQQPLSSSDQGQDASLSYAGTRVDSPYQGQDYNCYKPTTTPMFSQRKGISPVVSSAGPTPAYNNTTSFPTSSHGSTPKYDNSMILNHHKQQHEAPQSKNSFYHGNTVGSSSSLSTNSSRSSSQSHESNRTLASSSGAIATATARQQLFDISDHEDEALGWPYTKSTTKKKVASTGSNNSSTWGSGHHKSGQNPSWNKEDFINTQRGLEKMSLYASPPAASLAPLAPLANLTPLGTLGSTGNARYTPLTLDADLRDESSRVEYYEQVQLRFLVYCNTLTDMHREYAQRVCQSRTAKATWKDVARAQDPNKPMDSYYLYPSIEASMLKLCDLMEDQPSDQFTADVFVFAIKISAMQGRHEVYVKKFDYVLHSLHHEGGIDPVVLNRVFTFFVLHLLHYENDSIEAYNLLGKYFSTEDPLWEIVRSWLERDYLQWRRIYDNEDDAARKRVMQFGEQAMAKAAIQRMENPVSEKDIRVILGPSWQGLLGDMKCEWSRTKDGLIDIVPVKA